MRCGSYEINLDLPNLDTESDTTSRWGYVQIWQNGNDTIYSIKGDLPQYAETELAKQAEKKGYKYWFNNGSYFEIKRRNCNVSN